jgi:two-component system nitrate/nitrite response regulator NarL
MNRATADSGAASNRAGLETAMPPQTIKSDSAGTIRVLLADDHPVVRWGISCCIASHKRLVVVGEAANGLEAVQKAKELYPHVVVMDIEMPEISGLTATEILRRENPEVKVLLLSMYPCTGQMSRIVQSGARGFLMKSTKPADVVDAICRVAAGETCFGAELAREALNQFANGRGTAFDDRGLSQREREVLIGIAEGLGNKEIAAQLGISARTVETHRHHIVQKLNIHSIAGLTRFAISMGLITLKEKD